MPQNTNASQLGRGNLRFAFAGGTANLRFWATNGTVGSADGDNADNLVLIPWNARIRYAHFHCVNDPGIVIVGVHIDRNLVAEFAGTVTAAGADVVTFVKLEGLLPGGSELGISVDPANDPGVAYMGLALDYESPIA